MFGDDCGYVHILYFKNPINSLFDPIRRKTDPTNKSAANSIQRVFWDVSLFELISLFILFSSIQELKEHDKFVRYHGLGSVHGEYVRKILYIPHNNSIISSSGDNRNSLIITNLNKLKKPYIFRLYKVNFLW
jgi:hypothetical protein